MSTTLLIALYVACELIANVAANKPVSVFGIVAPGGVFIYALTFTLVDLLNERLGAARARRVVVAAFLANVLFALYAALIVALPAPAYYTGQEAFASVVGATPRIVSASLVAYLVSSMIDVEIFALWKRRIGGRPGIRVIVSNAVSTLVDSALFVLVAFAGILPLLPLILGQYVLKMAVTFVSVPLIHLVRDASSQPDGG